MMNKVDLYVRVTGAEVDADDTFCTCFALELSVIAAFTTLSCSRNHNLSALSDSVEAEIAIEV